MKYNTFSIRFIGQKPLNSEFTIAQTLLDYTKGSDFGTLKYRTWVKFQLKSQGRELTVGVCLICSYVATPCPQEPLRNDVYCIVQCC